MSLLIKKVFLGLATISFSIHFSEQTSANDTRVLWLGDSFVSHLPTSWNAVQGSWVYADIAKCFVDGPSCYGNNPSSPYGSPTFYNSNSGLFEPGFQMRADEVVEMFPRLSI